MSIDEDSGRLLERWRAGDEAAAQKIFDRYIVRLTALARSRLSSQLQRRIDPDDVVQSAFRSFFIHARAANNDDDRVHRSGDLWRYLAAITVTKVLKQVERHRAQKRSVDAEGSIVLDGRSLPSSPIALSQEPGPDELAALSDVLESFMSKLTGLEREILELRLQDAGTEEIAEEVGRSSRTVRRVLERLHDSLAEQLAHSD